MSGGHCAGESHGACVVTHNVMQISGGGKVLQLKLSSLVACSVICRRLRAGCSRLLVVFCNPLCNPEQIVCLVWSH